MQNLKTQLQLTALPIYLIDNSADERLSLALFSETAELASSLSVELRLVHGHGNIGYGRAHNLVLPGLESEYHLILNPDIILDANCLGSGIAFLQDNPDTVLVSPLAEHGNGEKQHLCKRQPSIFTLLVRGFIPPSLKKHFAARLANYEMHDLSEIEATPGIPLASGCFMLCRTQAVNKIAGFDEGYFLYFEDFDFSLRMREEGEIAYLPTMRIQHAGGYAAQKGFRHLQMFLKSGIRFFNTYGWRWF